MDLKLKQLKNPPSGWTDTKESIELAMKQAKEVDDYNKEIVTEIRKSLKIVEDFLKANYAFEEYKGKRRVKTPTEVQKLFWKLDEFIQPGCNVLILQQCLERIKIVEERNKQLEEENKKKEAIERSKNRKHLAAIEFLIKRNYKLQSGLLITPDGESINDNQFIDEANDVARKEAIDEMKPSEGEFIEFCGDDNCEKCHGWDGDYRCECGNRRVGWESDGDFENMNVWAQAY